MAETQYDIPIRAGNPPTPKYEVGNKVYIDAEKSTQIDATPRTVTGRQQNGPEWEYVLQKEGLPEGEVKDERRKESELSLVAKENDTA